MQHNDIIVREGDGPLTSIHLVPSMNGPDTGDFGFGVFLEPLLKYLNYASTMVNHPIFKMMIDFIKGPLTELNTIESTITIAEMMNIFGDLGISVTSLMRSRILRLRVGSTKVATDYQTQFNFLTYGLLASPTLPMRDPTIREFMSMNPDIRYSDRLTEFLFKVKRIVLLSMMWDLRDHKGDGFEFSECIERFGRYLTPIKCGLYVTPAYEIGVTAAISINSFSHRAIALAPAGGSNYLYATYGCLLDSRPNDGYIAKIFAVSKAIKYFSTIDKEMFEYDKRKRVYVKVPGNVRLVQNLMPFLGDRYYEMLRHAVMWTKAYRGNPSGGEGNLEGVGLVEMLEFTRNWDLAMSSHPVDTVSSLFPETGQSNPYMYPVTDAILPIGEDINTLIINNLTQISKTTP